MGEAGVSIAGAWDFATQLIPMATGIVRFGNRLSGGLAQLRRLLGGGAKIKSGSCFGHPCALPPGTDTVRISNAVYDATWLMHTVVHELAHIIDWHSEMELTRPDPLARGTRFYGKFSDAWDEAPLTNYAAGIGVGFRPYPDSWEVWAEAVTVWVFGSAYAPLDRILGVDVGAQMTRMGELLNGWR